jgi:hypothetical protein
MADFLDIPNETTSFLNVTDLVERYSQESGQFGIGGYSAEFGGVFN